MPDTRFIQIHTLHGYAAALLNRDDSGLAKRLPYGDAMRTRISSQCLKRHWRMAGGLNDLHEIDGVELAVRSRDLVTKRLRAPLAGEIAEEILDAVDAEFQKAIYGENADKGKRNRQPLLFGEPELRFLAERFAAIARAAEHAKAAKAAAAAFCKEKDFKDTMKAMRAQVAMPGGLTAALFGRMVTSDPAANIEAPVHVAHAFTVHAEESEADYFSVVDDLHEADEDAGADHIGETELTSGLFYGYVVLDVNGLVANLGGDRALAAEVARRLVHLIAEVSPGAKRGSTAPYAYADTVLVEAGDRQPRSLAESFRRPCAARRDVAEAAMAAHLRALDDAYRTGEVRRFASLGNETAFPGAERLPLPDLAVWVKDTLRGEAA